MLGKGARYVSAPPGIRERIPRSQTHPSRWVTDRMWDPSNPISGLQLFFRDPFRRLVPVFCEDDASLRSRFSRAAFSGEKVTSMRSLVWLWRWA
jgi:hypothetical protein